VPLIVPILILLPYLTVKFYQRSHRLNQLVNSLSQGSPDFEQMSHLLEHGPEARWTGVAAEEVSRLDEPDFKGFDVIQDSWITDLRSWKPGESGRSDPSSRVHHYRRLMVSMKPDNTGNYVFRWPLLARDPNADFRFLRQQIQPRLRKYLDVESSVPGERDCPGKQASTSGMCRLVIT
jgi:hypothetical protein